MDIASIIQTSFLLNADSPLFIEKSDRIITYADARSCIELYQQWTLQLIQDALSKTNPPCDSSFGSAVSPNFAFLGSNSPDYLLSALACIKCDRTVSLLNTRWTPLEISNTLRVQCTCSLCSPLNYHLNDSIPQRDVITVVIYSQDKKDVALQAMTQLSSSPCRKHRVFAHPLPYLSRQLSSTKCSPSPLSSIGINSSMASLDFCLIQQDQVTDRDAIILFTSGTSSSVGSKGCCLSHRSLFIQARAKTYHPCSYDKDSKLYATPLPLFHIGGFSSALGILMAGGSLVFSQSVDEVQTNFDPLKMIQCISSSDHDDTAQFHTRANTLAVVPAILHSLFGCLKDHVGTFSCVRMILVGGQSLSQSQLDKCHYFFPNARIIQTYACTEAGSSITFADLSQVRTLSTGLLGGSFVGYPPSHIEIQVLNQETVKKRPSGWSAHNPFHIGLICTKGPHVMNRYWCRDDLQSPKATCGWLVTSDLGYLTDQGGLYYCGRSDDVIRSGGESVLTMEVEKILMQHPLIDAVSVFPLVDEKFGHIVCAAIKPVHVGSFATQLPHISNVRCINSSGLDEIRGFCTRHELASYKHPKKIFIFRELPQNSSGKIMKHELVKICTAVDAAISRDSQSKL